MDARDRYVLRGVNARDWSALKVTRAGINSTYYDDRIQSVPDSIARPLGHGYCAIQSFLTPYLAVKPAGTGQSPDVARSLFHWSRSDAAIGHLRGLGDSPVCLMEGISSPRNGKALRRFLQWVGIAQPTIHAVDLANMKAIFDLMGEPLDDVIFHVGDAAALHGIESGSIDLLLQDFLLNCAPHCLHPAIVGEAARVLRRGGLGLIHFTDHRGLARLPRRMHPDPGSRVYGVGDMKGGWTGAAANVVLTEPGGDRLTLVTAPRGNFEFYFPRSYVMGLLVSNGLHPLCCLEWTGKDQHGNHCHRQLTLIRRGEL